MSLTEAQENNPVMDPCTGNSEQMLSTRPVRPVENPGSSGATRVLTTQVELTVSGSRWPLEMYAPSLARAREAWSIVTEKTAEFDTAFRVSCCPLFYSFHFACRMTSDVA